MEFSSPSVTLIPDMSAHLQNLKAILAAIMAIVMYSIPVFAQDSAAVQPQRDLPALYDELAVAGPDDAVLLVREISLEWSKSGSVTVNLLLRRGTDALERGDADAAIEHFTAVTDHAPEFAAGWNGRAKAWFERGNWGLAVADLEHVLALDPNHFEAVFGLAAILEQAGQPQKALAAYQLALGIHPHYDEAKQAVTRLKPIVGGRDL